MSQGQEGLPGQSGIPSTNRTGKAEVDLFPALADRKALSVVAPRAACNGPQISMFEPTNYEDALDIVECLRSRASTTVCLDKMRKSDANRLVDFISGASAAIDGRFHRLSEQVYFFAPSNVQIVVPQSQEPLESQWAQAQESRFASSSQPYSQPSSPVPSQFLYSQQAQGSQGVPPLNSRSTTSLDFLYPDTGNKSSLDNVWTRRQNYIFSY